MLRTRFLPFLIYRFFVLFPQEIQLSEILSVDSNIDPLQTDATRAPHCKTSDMVFYVGQVEDEKEIPDPDSGIWLSGGAGLGNRDCPDVLPRQPAVRQLRQPQPWPQRVREISYLQQKWPAWE